ncbi:MAG: VanZ family protein [Sphingobacteriia bacterium]|nr:VanZ family protein [Sphingobacteriia bacterium]
MKKKSALIPLLAFLLSLTCSIFLFTLPGKQLPSIGWLNIPYMDKYVHAAIFFTLCYTAAAAIYGFTGKKIGGLFALIIAGLFLSYGIGVEFYQEQVVEGRSFEWADIMADASGCLLFLIWIRFRKP